MTDKQRVKAAVAGQLEWGTHGSASEHIRYGTPVPPTSRRRCTCGCRRRATHCGMANGLGMMSGCEWSVAQWVRDPYWKATAEVRAATETHRYREAWKP